jgi:hypothetical protein
MAPVDVGVQPALFSDLAVVPVQPPKRRPRPRPVVEPVRSAAVPATSEERTRARAAMRRVLIDHGFEHALDSIATAVAVELVGSGLGVAVERRMENTADRCELLVLDALVLFAGKEGWKP